MEAPLAKRARNSAAAVDPPPWAPAEQDFHCVGLVKAQLLGRLNASETGVAPLYTAATADAAMQLTQEARSGCCRFAWCG